MGDTDTTDHTPAGTPSAPARTWRDRAPRAALALTVVLAAVAAVAGPWSPTGTPAAGAQQRGGPLGSVTIVLGEQHAYLYRPDGSLAARVPVSTGARGRTPRGTFHVYQRQQVGTASSDRSVHMDFFTVFVGGIGFHGIPWRNTRSQRLDTPLGERPVSHGCIRMRDEDAQWIFDALPQGATVVVK